VKEGDEFSKDEVQWYYSHRSFPTDSIVGEDFDSAFEKGLSREIYTQIFRIKCDKCSTFH